MTQNEGACWTRIAASVGDDAFKRLVGSADEVLEISRLRFWQARLLDRAGVSISMPTDFLDLFDGAHWRATGSSKDDLSAATTSSGRRSSGTWFQAVHQAVLGRVTNQCVFQCKDLQLSAYGGKEFAVNYASVLITRLQERGRRHLVGFPREIARRLVECKKLTGADESSGGL